MRAIVMPCGAPIGSGVQAMTERPILMSAPMVRAIRAGQKTQTRRVITRPHIYTEGECYDLAGCWIDAEGSVWGAEDAPCPYGRSGDLLWVRETWAPMRDGLRLRGSVVGLHPCPVKYRADYPDGMLLEGHGPWRSPRFMPRWASRLTLRVTDVRVERVQEITEADAVAEGVQANPDAPASLTDRSAFAKLWDTLNAKRGHGWDVNPWVWVVSFERAAPTEGREP